jgi:APA family basic amino acid/polyamine antiporter
VPYEWCHSPLEVSVAGVHGIMNVPALCILLLITLILIKGTAESATVNSIIVFVKVAIVLVFIAIGWKFMNPANHIPFTIPDGIDGHLDAVSTAAQETVNPGRDMPRGILGSLAVCTVLYILFSYVLTGVANWKEFLIAGKEASVAYAIDHHMPGFEWLATLVTIAILAGFSSVILVMLLGQSRVFFSMANDGLLPKVFSDLHPKFRTPYKSNMILFVFVGIFAAFFPESLAGALTSVGTLFAFVLVCIGTWIIRRTDPGQHRPFRTPLVPLVPILGMLICGAMIVGLDSTTQLTALGWMLVGFIVYFLYSKKHSRLNA